MDKTSKKGPGKGALPSPNKQAPLQWKEQAAAPGHVPAFSSFLLLLVAGGMELCWLYAAAAFFMKLADASPFPPVPAMGAFWLAVVLTRMTRGLGWRVFQTLLLHLAGLGAVLLCLLYGYFVHGAVPFFTQAWLRGIFSGPKDALGIFTILILLMFAGIFYLDGLALGRRPGTYLSIVHRLDLGIGLFILLLLLNAGIGPPDPVVTLFLFPFFFFSMLGLFLARSKGEGKKEYLQGQRWTGLLLTFSIGVLIFAGGAVLFLMPYLTAAADTGLTLLKWFFRPLFYSFLLPILRFMFGPRPVRGVSEPGGFSDGSDVLMPETVPESFWGELVAKILGLGIAGLAVLALLILAGWGLRRLFRWLLTRTPQNREQRTLWPQFLLWLAVLRLYAAKLFSFIRRLRGRRLAEGSEAVKSYIKLLSWGRACGFPRRLYETPAEYGLRLAAFFPAVESEVAMIVSIFNREIYGEISADAKQVALLRRAWRKMSSPLLWFSRFAPGKK